MPAYKKMYLSLFNAITTAIDQLKNAQMKGEDTYIESDDTPLTILPQPTDKKPEDDE